MPYISLNNTYTLYTKPPQIFPAVLGVVNADAPARHNIFRRKILGGFFKPQFFAFCQVPFVEFSVDFQEFAKFSGTVEPDTQEVRPRGRRGMRTDLYSSGRS